MPATKKLEGGCYCGAIRYEISEVYDAGYCHCSICRRMSGAPAVAWANLPSKSFRLLSGEPRKFQSSASWARFFCPACGSPVYQQVPSPPPDGSDLICVLVPTLDDPERVKPKAHIWCSSRLSYFETADTLPRFAGGELSDPKNRERGLTGRGDS